MPPKPRSAEYFDGWYADRVATPTVDESMNRQMGFPPDTRAEVVDRVRSGGDRIWNVVMNVPAFPGRVPDTDLTFFDPGQVVDLLAAHGGTDQIGSYLRRLGGGLQSTGTVRIDGSAILAAARRHLADEAQTRQTVAAHMVDALNRAECSQLLAGPLPDGQPA